MSELYLYHATDANNVQSIMDNGLVINPPHHNWPDMYCDDKIFLAFDAAVAAEYAHNSVNSPKQIVIFKVRLDSLHEDSIGYDWNNRCEYTKDINSCTYSLDIPANLLTICQVTSEPTQTIYTFANTDMYERILAVFDEEVETNMEYE